MIILESKNWKSGSDQLIMPLSLRVKKVTLSVYDCYLNFAPSEIYRFF